MRVQGSGCRVRGAGAVLGAVLATTVAAGSARAQTPAASPAPKPSPVEAGKPPAPARPPAETYSYNPEGRRDPFVSLLARGNEASGTAPRRGAGLAGLTIGEVALRGIVRSRDSYVAIIQAPDNKTYIIHSGDRLADGSVKGITADAVIFSQEVNDPLSLVKQREVRKPLRASQEGA